MDPTRYSGSGMYLDVKFLFLDRAGLRFLLIVDVEPYLLTGVDSQPFLQHLPDTSDTIWLGSVSQPYCELITLRTHIHNRAVHLK